MAIIVTIIVNTNLAKFVSVVSIRLHGFVRQKNGEKRLRRRMVKLNDDLFE
jgi:hypothetical protein